MQTSLWHDRLSHAMFAQRKPAAISLFLWPLTSPFRTTRIFSYLLSLTTKHEMIFGVRKFLVFRLMNQFSIFDNKLSSMVPSEKQVFGRLRQRWRRRRWGGRKPQSGQFKFARLSPIAICQLVQSPCCQTVCAAYANWHFLFGLTTRPFKSESASTWYTWPNMRDECDVSFRFEWKSAAIGHLQ